MGILSKVLRRQCPNLRNKTKMMNRYFLLVLIALIFSGCTTLGSVNRKYTHVIFTDGVTREEAKIIAQREYLNSNSNDGFNTGSARVYDSNKILKLNPDKVSFVTHEKIYEKNRKKLKFNNSWYVSFKPKFFNFFSSYYLVVLNKNDGQVQYSYDSNVFTALGQLMFTHLKPKLMSSMLIGKYYREKNQLPEDIDQLRKYLLEKRKNDTNEEVLLNGYVIEKISDNKINVKYIPEEGMQDVYDALSEMSSKLNPKGEYELEVSKEGEKTILQTYGDMDMRFELTDDIMVSGEITNSSKEDVDKTIDEIFKQLFE